MKAVIPAGGAGVPDTSPTFTTDPRTASWLLGLALACATDGMADDDAAAELFDEAGGSARALEGAYGRGVVLLGEYPSDPTLRQAVDLISKALRRCHRQAPAAGYE